MVEDFTATSSFLSQLYSPNLYLRKNIFPGKPWESLMDRWFGALLRAFCLELDILVLQRLEVSV